MADNDRIVFPDEELPIVEEPTISKRAIADNNRMIFPDEVDDVKAKVRQETKEMSTNSIEEPPIDADIPQLITRNFIQAPPNKRISPEQQMDKLGIPRDLFD